jgi:hypothetical protein
VSGKPQDPDPRIAPLAEALDAGGVGCATTVCPDHTSKDRAAAILAALPPDWCGHGEYEAEMERLWALDCAELARLRAIEEAARAVDWESVQDALDVAVHAHAEMEVNKERWRADENALDALRAALGEDR